MIALSPAPTTAKPDPTGLLLCRDLIFTTKVMGTAKALGYHVQVAGDVRSAQSAIETLCPRVIFIDLTAGELVAPQALSHYLKLAGPDVWFVAFGPHVDEAALAAAKAAGCQVVLPRSKFAGDLPRLMQLVFQPSVQATVAESPPKDDERLSHLPAPGFDRSNRAGRSPSALASRFDVDERCIARRLIRRRRRNDREQAK